MKKTSQQLPSLRLTRSTIRRLTRSEMRTPLGGLPGDIFTVKSENCETTTSEECHNSDYCIKGGFGGVKLP